MPIQIIKNAILAAAAVVGLNLLGGCKSGQPLTLARDGKTEYVIVVADDASGVDKYAAAELSRYLKQIAGADYPVVEPKDMDPAKPCIFIGLSSPALKILGKDPMAVFKDQDNAARKIGKNIFLYGKGLHGNLYAVMDFLENSLAWRWFSVFEYPLLPEKTTVTIEPFNRKQSFSFRYCLQDLQRSIDYGYQMGANLYFDQKFRGKTDLPREKRAFVSAFHEVEHGAGNHHTFFSFIPPSPDNRFVAYFDWQKKKDYFTTNPDYYSMNADGKRAPRQLCFGNPDLRAEFTKQAMRLIEVEGDDITVCVCALDTPDMFCHCPSCKVLMDKHQSPGGPLYDYLIELCGILQEKHPKAHVYTIAYRRSQTEIPPKLPEGGKLPSNLIVNFAPIEDCLFADWTHPDENNQETYRHLKEWANILGEGNLMSLYYGPYGAAMYLPIGDIDRLVTNMRLMHAAGARGIQMDQDMHSRSAFSELRNYLFYKLRKDVNADIGAIIREFTGYMYGPAAELIRTYLNELEAARKEMISKGLPMGVSFHAPLEQKNFLYLTPENIHRWQGYFDKMAVLAAKGPDRCRVNVELARRSLDIATLWKWFELTKKYPEIYRDHQVFVERISAAEKNTPLPMAAWEQERASRPEGFAEIRRKWMPLGDSVVSDLATIIKGGGQVKPLPQELAGLDQSRVKRFVPANRFSVVGKDYPPVGDRVVLDPDAAFGFAATTYLPPQHPGQKLPFTFGYRQERKSPSITRSIKLDEITPGVYRLYKLGEVIVTPAAMIWMPEWSCSTILEIGQRLYEPGAENRWEAYLSLKFDGPTYGGPAKEDRVLVDQVIMVRKSDDQFKAK